MLYFDRAKEIFEGLIDFLFPRNCLSCGVSRAFLCGHCLGKIPTHQIQHCPDCRCVSALGALCENCRNKLMSVRWNLDGLWVVSPYAQGSVVQTMIQRMKYHHGYEIAKTLGPWMAEHFLKHSAWTGEIHVAPVPLHPSKERLRGYNQAFLLAQGFSESTHFHLSPFIQRTINTFPQAQLSRDERLTNLKNVFSIQPGLPNDTILNKKFVLIDDVCSTGSTLNECAVLLKSHGADLVWGIVIARGG